MNSRRSSRKNSLTSKTSSDIFNLKPSYTRKKYSSKRTSYSIKKNNIFNFSTSLDTKTNRTHKKVGKYSTKYNRTSIYDVSSSHVPNRNGLNHKYQDHDLFLIKGKQGILPDEINKHTGRIKPSNKHLIPSTNIFNPNKDWFADNYLVTKGHHFKKHQSIFNKSSIFNKDDATEEVI